MENQLTNSVWPPYLGKIIIAKRRDNEDDIFIGIVLQLVWNNTAAIVELLNKKDFIDKTILNNNLLKGESCKGYFLLINSYKWDYLTEEAIMDILKKYSSDQLINDLDIKIKKSYQEFLETIPNESKLSENISQGTRGCFEEIPTFEPLLNKMDGDLNNLFEETKYKEMPTMDIKTDPQNFPDSVVMDYAMKSLKQFYQIPKDRLKLVLNKTVAIDNLITDLDDEFYQAEKIMKYLKAQFEKPENRLVTNLKLTVKNGYIHILRKNIDADDIITDKLIKDLKYFKWQYGKPIDYNTLKFILFQNKFQQQLETDQQQLLEAEKILSQEYLIAFQPDPMYLMWCLIRLIICWYADIDLQFNIRKIKVLINQFRAKNNEEYNKKRGVLPSIVIYPRYGFKSARIVLSRLSELFAFYIDKGWDCSLPTYFIKINRLMYYTNGIVDLKLYYRRVMEETKNNSNLVFNDKFTKFKSSKDFFNL